MNILIVKTSSYGDIIQTFDVLCYLKKIFPEVNIDWVASKKCFDLVKSHPYVRKVYYFDNIFNVKFIKKIRKNKYDVIFDLQGNCKSGIITFFSKGLDKVGFSYKNIAEWPNLLFTNFKVEVDCIKNIREQYLELIKKYFNKNILVENDVLLKILPEEKKEIDDILNNKNIKMKKKILIAPYSKWGNKEMDKTSLLTFLKKIDSCFDVFYFFVWGNDEEKKKSFALHDNFKKNSIILKKSTFGFLQHFIKNLDIVISVDSCILHLSSNLKNVKLLGIFGPTSKEVYMPIGENCFSYQGICPRKIRYKKRCSYLRNCKDGRCMKDIKGEELFYFFKSCFFSSEKN
ncbi:MAG: hypothetical protein AMS24_04370 [Chlamydiae bacterium SM23_39]|nr:MAG: hypothetical protein AMS24_04370 [Chlamydiae bacterium SM23_39]